MAVNWVVYGTSGHTNPVDGLVMENYVRHAKLRDRVNHTVKLIVNPRVTERFERTPHTVKYISDEYTSVSERDSYIDGRIPFFKDASYERFRLNHYSTKSEAEYIDKLCRRGWPDQEHRTYDIGDENIKKKLELAKTTLNAEYDDVMMQYVDEVKAKISEFLNNV